ncbi:MULTISPECIES: glycoside hydrolase family protein [unclassified Microcoleus]|uniref:glycoside hydrolase family protein n=1 Tax=unclassified Microcoleus TaxID=2642155 RepID=UPI0025E2D0A3|nr:MULTISPECIES: glycoside hydrolase family protein [unclassified Microcoleus]
MQPSQDCLNLIKESEGLHRKLADGRIGAYIDPVGVWTIGYGSIHHIDKNRAVKQGDVITEADASRWLNLEVEQKAAAVNDLCKVSLKQGMFDALVSFTFNFGSGALKKSTLLRKLNGKDYEGAAREFDRWIHGAGKVLPGLVIRRNKEEALFRRDGWPGDDIEITPSDNAVTPLQKPYQPPELPLKITRTLKEGFAGEDCYILNCALAERGFLKLDSQPNSYTAVTKEVVARFQGENNLKLDGIFGPKTKATLAAALAKSRKRLPEPMLERVYCRLTRTNDVNSDGLEWLSLDFISSQGNILNSLSVVSGISDTQQNFNLPEDSDAGSLEPIPQGRYVIGDIDWASGKDNYDVAHFHQNDGIGPVFVPLIKHFTQIDDRDAFGFHVDWNERHSPGSAGCVCPTTMEDLKELVRLLRLYDPRDLFVDWGLL